MGTLIATVAFYALAVSSLGSRGEGLRATWASERVALPPGSPKRALRQPSEIPIGFDLRLLCR
jgi:hypothetical protein